MLQLCGAAETTAIKLSVKLNQQLPETEELNFITLMKGECIAGLLYHKFK